MTTYGFRARPVFAWYDFWVGLYWDRKKSTLYVFLLPMFGFSVEFYKTEGGEGDPIVADEVDFSYRIARAR